MSPTNSSLGAEVVKEDLFAFSSPTTVVLLSPATTYDITWSNQKTADAAGLDPIINMSHAPLANLEYLAAGPCYTKNRQFVSCYAKNSQLVSGTSPVTNLITLYKHGGSTYKTSFFQPIIAPITATVDGLNVLDQTYRPLVQNAVQNDGQNTVTNANGGQHVTNAEGINVNDEDTSSVTDLDGYEECKLALGNCIEQTLTLESKICTHPAATFKVQLKPGVQIEDITNPPIKIPDHIDDVVVEWICDQINKEFIQQVDSNIYGIRMYLLPVYQNGRIRFCIDARKVNDNTIDGDQFSMSSQGISQHMATTGFTHITQWDVKSAYQCVKIEDDINFYLGFNNDGSLSTHPTKFKALAEAPVPETIKQLQSYLGAIHFNRLSYQMVSDACKPFYNLIKGRAKGKLTQDEHEIVGQGQVVLAALLKNAVQLNIFTPVAENRTLVICVNQNRSVQRTMTLYNADYEDKLRENDKNIILPHGMKVDKMSLRSHMKQLADTQGVAATVVGNNNDVDSDIIGGKSTGEPVLGAVERNNDDNSTNVGSDEPEVILANTEYPFSNDTELRKEASSKYHFDHATSDVVVRRLMDNNNHGQRDNNSDPRLNMIQIGSFTTSPCDIPVTTANLTDELKGVSYMKYHVADIADDDGDGYEECKLALGNCIEQRDIIGGKSTGEPVMGAVERDNNNNRNNNNNINNHKNNNNRNNNNAQRQANNSNGQRDNNVDHRLNMVQTDFGIQDG